MAEVCHIFQTQILNTIRFRVLNMKSLEMMQHFLNVDSNESDNTRLAQKFWVTGRDYLPQGCEKYLGLLMSHISELSGPKKEQAWDIVAQHAWAIWSIKWIEQVDKAIAEAQRSIAKNAIPLLTQHIDLYFVEIQDESVVHHILDILDYLWGYWTTEEKTAIHSVMRSSNNKVVQDYYAEMVAEGQFEDIP